MNIPSKPYCALMELYQLTEIQESVRDVHEMLGFICAIAASPQPLELSEWFPCLWLQGGAPSFTQEALAVDFAAAVLQFHAHCSLNYQQSKALTVPSQLWLTEEQQVNDSGIAFASGYLAGFEYIEVSCSSLNLLTESELDPLLQTALLLLNKMATPNIGDTQMQMLFLQLPDMLEIISSLPLLLSAVGHLSLQVADNGGM